MHCWVTSTSFFFSKVWLLTIKAMFCLYTSSSLSRPWFEFSLKVMGSYPGYLLKKKSTLDYLHTYITCRYVANLSIKWEFFRLLWLGKLSGGIKIPSCTDIIGFRQLFSWYCRAVHYMFSRKKSQIKKHFKKLEFRIRISWNHVDSTAYVFSILKHKTSVNFFKNY